jgi:anti-sigma B factor antagonist
VSPSSSTLAQPFCVDVVPRDGEIVVEAIGELDLHSADVLEGEVVRLRRDGHDRVVVDLRGVEFMDSTGLRLLIGLQRAAQREGRALSLVPGPRPVQRIFELTATHALFDWRD